MGLLQQRGLSHETAARTAVELSEHDALGAHLGFELGLNENELANPWTAAGSSALAFSASALLPLVAILLPPASARIAIAFAAVLVGLIVTGWLSAQLGRAPKGRAIIRLVAGGALAMAVTFGIGRLVAMAIG